MVDFFKPSRHLQLRRFGEVHPPGAIDLIAHCHYFRLIDEPHGEILYVAGLSTSAGTTASSTPDVNGATIHARSRERSVASLISSAAT